MKVIITSVNGRIVNIATSGDAEIYLIESTISSESMSKLEPDFQFLSGEAHRLTSNNQISQFLKKHNV